jgi:general secretion pathway protein F
MAAFSSSEFAEFNALLASAVERGLPLEPALGLLAAQARFTRVRRSLETLHQAIREGRPLPAALRSTPGFSPEDAALVEAGVAAGRLAEVLRGAASYHALVAGVRQKFRRFLAYLAIGLLLSCAVCAVGAFLGFRVESMQPYISGIGTEAPIFWKMAQRPLLVVGLACGTLVVLSGLAFGLAAWMSRRRPGYWIPLWGRLLRARDLALSCSVLGLRLQAGTPAPAALRSAAAAVPNRYARRRLEEAARRVEEGGSLSDALFYLRWFPRSLAWGVSLGERRGELPAVVATFARIYGAETERAFEMLFVLLAPMGIIALGNVAFLAALLILVPIFQLISYTQVLN